MATLQITPRRQQLLTIGMLVLTIAFGAGAIILGAIIERNQAPDDSDASANCADVTAPCAPNGPYIGSKYCHNTFTCLCTNSGWVAYDNEGGPGQDRCGGGCDAGHPCTGNFNCNQTTQRCEAAAQGCANGGAQCAANQFCNEIANGGAGVCENDRSLGESCGEDNWCVSNICVSSTCMQCRGSSDTSCGNSRFCNTTTAQFYSCENKRGAGALCLGNEYCQSGVCSNSVCQGGGGGGSSAPSSQATSSGGGGGGGGSSAGTSNPPTGTKNVSLNYRFPQNAPSSVFRVGDQVTLVANMTHNGSANIDTLLFRANYNEASMQFTSGTITFGSSTGNITTNDLVEGNQNIRVENILARINKNRFRPGEFISIRLNFNAIAETGGQVNSLAVINADSGAFTREDTLSLQIVGADDALCGEACANNSACPLNHSCSGGRCVLTACLAAGANCTADRCAINLPNTAIFDPENRPLLVGLVLIVIGILANRFVRTSNQALYSTLQTHSAAPEPVAPAPRPKRSREQSEQQAEYEQRFRHGDQ